MERPKIAVSGQNVSGSLLHPLRYAFAVDICIVCSNKIYSFRLEVALNYPSAVGASTAKRPLLALLRGDTLLQTVVARSFCSCSTTYFEYDSHEAAFR